MFCDNTPTRLVALASAALKPVKINTGKVMSEPAAETAFTNPAKMPAPIRIRMFAISNSGEYREGAGV